VQELVAIVTTNLALTTTSTISSAPQFPGRIHSMKSNSLIMCAFTSAASNISAEKISILIETENLYYFSVIIFDSLLRDSSGNGSWLCLIHNNGDSC
jgi:hypothetical protein